MLHNTTRYTLLQSKNGYVALILDALYFLGWTEYTQFTYQQAFEALAPLGIYPKMLRIALKSPLFAKSGQRSAVYTLPAVSTVRKRVSASDEIADRDILPSDSFKSLKNYRMALFKAFMERRSGFHYREWLAELFGVVGATIYNYCQRLGIQRRPNILRHDLTNEWLFKIPEYAYSGRYWLHITTKNLSFDAPFNREIAFKWLKRKAKIVIMEQRENWYGFPA